MSQMYTDLYVKSRYSCPILMKLEFSRQILGKKYLNMEFHENPFSEGADLFYADERTDKHAWRR